MLPKGLKKLINPKYMGRLHMLLTLLWFILIFPSATLWKDSVPYLVAISVYAVIMGHIASWQATRVEELEDNDDDVAEVHETLKQLKALVEKHISEVNE